MIYTDGMLTQTVYVNHFLEWGLKLWVRFSATICAWKIIWLLTHYGHVRFVEKTSRNTVPVDLLWEKNTVSAEKTSWKRRIIREANRPMFLSWPLCIKVHCTWAVDAFLFVFTPVNIVMHIWQPKQIQWKSLNRNILGIF